MNNEMLSQRRTSGTLGAPQCSCWVGGAGACPACVASRRSVNVDCNWLFLEIFAALQIAGGLQGPELNEQRCHDPKAFLPALNTAHMH